MMAAQMYEEAVRLDPAFAAAWARLSMVYSEIYFAAFADPRDPYLDKAKEAVDKAMAIDADMPEAHIALGLYYYRGFKDYDHALAEFESARLIQPNNADLWESTAYVQRRRGEWEEAVASLKMAIELDPLGSHKYAGLLTTLIPMRRYDEARTYVDRYVSLWPDDGDPYQKRISLYLMSTGDTDVIRRVLVDASTNADSEELQANWVQLYVIERDYRSALGLLSIEPDSVGYYLEKAKIYGLMNRPELRRAYSDSARTLLEAKIESDPDEHALFSQLGLALAGLDRKREAIRAGERAVELVPMSADTYRGTTVLLSLAEIYAHTGEADAAIDKLEFLLSVPSYISVALLRVDPAWDPLREHPRFEELLGTS
jgi:serine/threonine-protein kinase